MSKISMWSRSGRLAFVCGLVLGLAAPALGETFYSWTTDDGVAAYTDDAKRIPSRYRGRVQERELQQLEGFERYTKVDTPAGQSARPEGAGLPAVSAPPPSPIVMQAGGGTVLDLGDIELRLDNLPGDEPVVVEQVRMRPVGDQATRTVKVVRQGDRVIAVIKPTRNQSDPSFVPSEADLD